MRVLFVLVAATCPLSLALLDTDLWVVALASLVPLFAAAIVVASPPSGPCRGPDA